MVEELKAAILEDMKDLGDAPEEEYFLYTEFNESRKMLTIVYDFTKDVKILYQAKKFVRNIGIKRVYITRPMLDVFKNNQ